jgi:transcriptional regulator with XRE-family HTH domain
MLLREARGPRSMAEIAAVSGVPAETLRKIETGRIATPAFFTVAALAAALGLCMEEIARLCAEPAPARPAATSSHPRPSANRQRQALSASRMPARA